MPHLQTTAVGSVLAAGTETVDPSGTIPQLVIAALVGIVVIIVLITWLKVHPFVALTIGALGVGIGAGSHPSRRSRASATASARP